jgi:hypothetical protein
VRVIAAEAVPFVTVNVRDIPGSRLAGDHASHSTAPAGPDAAHIAQPVRPPAQAAVAADLSGTLELATSIAAIAVPAVTVPVPVVVPADVDDAVGDDVPVSPPAFNHVGDPVPVPPHADPLSARSTTPNAAPTSLATVRRDVAPSLGVRRKKPTTVLLGTRAPPTDGSRGNPVRPPVVAHARPRSRETGPCVIRITERCE